MATLEQLEGALRNADKAGDTAAARKLAQEIIRQREQEAGQGAAPTGETTRAGSALSGLGQGLTFGFGDELAAGLAATVKRPFSDQSWGDLYREQLEVERGNLAAARANHPGITTAGEVAGAITTGAGLARNGVTLMGRAASLPGRIAAGAAEGGAYGAAYGAGSAEEGERARGAEQAAKWGALFGAAIPAVTGAAARVIRPNAKPQAERLIREGVKPTPGQALGGSIKAAEEKLTSRPILGEAIKASQRRAIESFNMSTMARALKPIGKTLPKNVKPGHDAFRYVDDAVAQAYDNLMPKLSGKIDSAFSRELDTVRSMAQSLPADRAAQVGNIIDGEIVSRFTGSGLATGRTIKEIESKLGAMARGYRTSAARSGNYDEQRVGEAVLEMQAALRRMLERNNPAQRGELKKVNTAFAHLLRVERAMASQGVGEGGIFTPAQYNAAVRAFDSSRRKGAFARGQAMDQDLAMAAKDVLGRNYPDSGTAGRLQMLRPGNLILAPLEIAASAAYSPVIQNALVKSATARPAYANSLALGVRRAAPALTPLAGEMAAQQ